MRTFEVQFIDGESELFDAVAYTFEDGFAHFFDEDGDTYASYRSEVIVSVAEVDESDDEEEDDFEDDEDHEDDDEEDYLADLIKSIVVQELAERNAATVSASQPF